MVDEGASSQTESGVVTVEQGKAGFGHLTTGKKTGVGVLGLMAALGLGGNVYQGTADARDATSLTEIQTGLTEVISQMDERHADAMTRCMLLLADEPLPVERPSTPAFPDTPSGEEGVPAG